MTLQQSILLLALGSVPLVAVLSALRGAVCVYRAQRARRWASVALASGGILVLLAALAASVVLWLAYAVSHTGKDETSDLLLLAGTGLPVGALAALNFWLCVHLERRL